MHVVVKAMSEQGVRLNIRKATLREWRRDFARYLREYGVEVNVTERAVRGSYHQNRKPGIYRTAARGESSFVRERAETVARQPLRAGVRSDAGHFQLIRARREVERGWRAFAAAMDQAGQHELAAQTRQFVERDTTGTVRPAMDGRADTRSCCPPVNVPDEMTKLFPFFGAFPHGDWVIARARRAEIRYQKPHHFHALTFEIISCKL